MLTISYGLFMRYSVMIDLRKDGRASVIGSHFPPLLATEPKQQDTLL